MTTFNPQRGQRVKAHYQDAIQDIMSEYDIDMPQKPDYEIEKDTGFADAVRYTEYYIGKTQDDRPDNQPHYRYSRYLGVLLNSLQKFSTPERRIAHVDIGCGAGLFSWAFLDWATENKIGFDSLGLYGYDHCSAMIRLSEEIRDKLAIHITGYPDIYYCDRVDELSTLLSETYRENTDYIITFGYVLVQAHTSREIKKFTKAIHSVAELMDDGTDCMLVADDSNRWRNDDSGRRVYEFQEGWNSLLESLEQIGIQHNTVRNGFMCAELYPR